MENPVYWDSFGAASVLRSLFGGDLFDGDGWPILTAVVLAGVLLVAVGAWAQSRQASVRRYLLFLTLVGIFGYFGRPTWGNALALLPFSGSLPLHRFIVVVHLAGVLLAGVAIAFLWELLGWQRSASRTAIAALLTLLMLAIPVSRAWETASNNSDWHGSSAEEWEALGPSLTQAMASIREAEAVRPGRCYAGTSWDGGAAFSVARVPVYLHWGPNRLSAISYMLHTMGRATETEPRFDPSRRDHYDLFNVRYLLTPNRLYLPDFATPFGVFSGAVAAAVETPGYFEVVDSDTFVDTTTSSYEAIDLFQQAFIASEWHAEGQFPRVGWQEGDGARDTERLITTADLEEPAQPVAGRAGVVSHSERAGETYSARVEAYRPATVLFRMTFHSGWYAEVDGVEQEVIMLAPSYVGVPVEPGEHDILLRYRAAPGLNYLRWLGPLIVGFTLLGERRSRRRSESETKGTN